MPIASRDVPATRFVPRLILASASPRRLDLLRQIAIEPDLVEASAIDETPLRTELPRDYALRMAKEKVEAVARRYPGEIVLAADTVVALGRRILPKAEDEKTARCCLSRLSGRAHRVYGALALVLPDGVLRQKLVITRVTFKRLNADEIEGYLTSGEWQEKAGGYAIQGRAGGFVIKISGSYSNVVGLSLPETLNLLRSSGYAGETRQAR